MEVWYGPEFFLELGGGGRVADTYFEGTVIDEGGPVSGAVVSVIWREVLDQAGLAQAVRISTVTSVLTDINGRFRLPEPVRFDAALRICAQGYEQYVAEIGGRTNPSRIVRLQRQRSFFVHVFDRQGRIIRPLQIEGFGHDGRPVLEWKSPLKYASDEYPFQLSSSPSSIPAPVSRSWRGSGSASTVPRSSWR